MLFLRNRAARPFPSRHSSGFFRELTSPSALCSTNRPTRLVLHQMPAPKRRAKNTQDASTQKDKRASNTKSKPPPLLVALFLSHPSSRVVTTKAFTGFGAQVRFLLGTQKAATRRGKRHEAAATCRTVKVCFFFGCPKLGMQLVCMVFCDDKTIQLDDESELRVTASRNVDAARFVWRRHCCS